MRKVTKFAANAMKHGDSFRMGNTKVESDGAGGSIMLLHGHKIASFNDGMLALYDAGWRTRTTKERLNGVLDVFEIPAQIYSKNFEWFMGWYGLEGRPTESWEGYRAFRIPA